MEELVKAIIDLLEAKKVLTQEERDHINSTISFGSPLDLTLNAIRQVIEQSKEAP